ncbi:MAG: polysaccharide biosynthesis/export family protein, partial [Alphaproteobacteria bacterium]
YRLAPGDRLRIATFGHPDVSGEFAVDAAGFIVFPLLGQVSAAGKDVDALTQEMTAELDRRFIVDPSLSIDVLNFRPFFILGQVNRPDSYPYRSGLTVRQAVALAGGFTRRAKTGVVTIVRQGDEGPQEFRASIDTGLLPGDTVEVSRRLF